jgi:hypothetical protein
VWESKLRKNYISPTPSTALASLLLSNGCQVLPGFGWAFFLPREALHTVQTAGGSLVRAALTRT